MNVQLKNNCVKTCFFSSIKYYAHNMETEDMHNFILEVMHINPYLAVSITKTAENDPIFFQQLLNEIKSNAGHFIRVDRRIMLILALGEAEDIDFSRYLSTLVKVKGINSNRSREKVGLRPISGDEWEAASRDWLLLLANYLLENNYISEYVSLKSKEVITSSLKIETDADEAIRRALADKNYFDFFQLIEGEGGYGKLTCYGYDIEKEYESTLFHMGHGSYTDAMLSALGKLTAIYLYKTGNDENVGKITEQVGRKAAKKIGKVLESYREHKQTPTYILQEKDFKYWNAEKNGIEIPVAYYCTETDSFWIKRKCGHEYRTKKTRIRTSCEVCRAEKKKKRIG